jgi:TonB family protein
MRWHFVRPAAVDRFCAGGLNSPKGDGQMGWKTLASVSGALSVLLASVFAMTAQAEDEDLPTIHTVACDKACANSTGPIPDFHPIPRFPQDNIDWYGAYVEGYVLLHYTIEPDGHISDIAMLELVGPKNFANSALNTVKDWTYKPATLNGKPVAICRTLMVDFKVPWATPGGRSEVVRLYDRAVQQIKDAKLDEAMASLSEAQAMPKLNFYERGMIANLSSMILINKGDYLEAHRLAKLATDHGLDELKRSVVRNLWETRIKASVGLGDMVDALDSLDRLKKVSESDEIAPVVTLVENTRAKVDSAPVFLTTGKIPDTDKGQGTYFGLYRRNFGFAGISGSLDGFTLSCKQQAIESKITAGAEWHVPKSWSDCHIFVRGAPGTTFSLAQATE